jgi:hypothetical protein
MFSIYSEATLGGHLMKSQDVTIPKGSFTWLNDAMEEGLWIQIHQRT